MSRDPAGKANSRVLFSDLLGLSHGRVLLRDKVTQAFHLCMTLMAQERDGRDDIIDGYGAEVGSPDMEAVIDESSMIVGWQPDA